MVSTAPGGRFYRFIYGSEYGSEVEFVVDAVTGRTITDLAALMAAVDVFEPTANGVIVKRAAAFGTERVAVDLDGGDRWSLIGDQPLFLGDGVVVAVAPGGGGVAVTAYADAIADSGVGDGGGADVGAG